MSVIESETLCFFDPHQVISIHAMSDRDVDFSIMSYSGPLQTVRMSLSLDKARSFVGALQKMIAVLEKSEAEASMSIGHEDAGATEQIAAAV